MKRRRSVWSSLSGPLKWYGFLDLSEDRSRLYQPMFAIEALEVHFAECFKLQDYRYMISDLANFKDFLILCLQFSTQVYKISRKEADLCRIRSGLRLSVRVRGFRSVPQSSAVEL